MAATFVASTAVGTASPTLPAGTVSGDYVCVAAYRNAGTAPTLPAGWILVTKSDTNPAHLVAKREYDGAWTMPTFTNANRCVAITVRAAAGKEIEVGNVLSEARSNANPNWSALTLQKPDGTGLILRGLAHTRPDASPPTPANHTLIDSNGTQPGYGTYRKNSSTDAAAASITISRSTTYTVFTVEVKEVDFAGGTVALTDGRDTLGSTATSIPPISVTQAAYRFYGAGSETGSAPRANQNTPPTGNLDLGDAFGTIRVLMQSNAGSIFPSTDDWTMQWEKNANGSWRDVLVPPTLIHMYDASNVDSANQLGTTTSPEVGQTFLGRGATITKAGFYINRIGTPSAGNITCAIYPMTGGVLGTNGVPSNPPTALAVSTTSIAASSVSTSLGWVDFDFSPFTTVSDVPYVVVLRCPNVGNTSNCIQVAGDSTSPTHVGNSTTRQQNGAWNTNSAFDFVFRIYGDDAVVPWDDPALTDGQATTNRLTGGTGTFVPGQVTEDGIIDNLGITADNFTELAFSVRIKASAFTQGDQLRFRVLRNGAPDVITYTQVPLANVTKTVAPQTVTLAQTDGLDTMSGAAGAPQVTVRLQTSGASCGFHRGTNTGDINGTPTGWVVTALDSALTFTRVASAPGVAGPAKIQLRDSTTSTAVEYVTLPLAEAITINSPIDFSIWALQSAAVNIALNAKVDKVSPTGVLTEIGRSNNTVDLPINAAGNAANSSQVTFSCPVTTTDFAPGDRFRITFFGQDSAAGTMTAGGSVLMFSGGADETVNGSQTSITFNNPVVFNKTVPTGTQLFFTSTAGPNVGADTELEMWTSRGTAAVSSFRAAASAGWAAPEQHQLASVNLEWYSKQLNPVTLDGFIRVRFSGSCGNTSNHTSPRFQVAVCDNDGSNAVIWVDHCGISGQPNGVTSFPNGELNPATSNTDFYVQGNPLAIAPGQRLRFRTFLDDTALTPRALGGSITFRYAATSANSDGDAYLILPQTVTEFSGITTSDGTLTATDGIDTMSASAESTYGTMAATDSIDVMSASGQSDPPINLTKTHFLPASQFTASATRAITGCAWGAGQKIIVFNWTSSNVTTCSAPTNANLTFTPVAGATATPASGEANFYTWEATASSLQTNQTITLNRSAGTGTIGGIVHVISDGSVLQSDWNRTEAAFSKTISTGSVVLYGAVDWNLTNPGKTITAGSGTATERIDSTDVSFGAYTLYAGDWINVSAGTYSFGVTNYTGWVVTHGFVEVGVGATTSTGTLALADGQDFLLATVTTPVYAELDQSDGQDEIVAIGDVPPITGTLALTDGIDTLVGVATSTPPSITITLALTDGPDTMVATATTTVPTFTSTLALTDTRDFAAMSGTRTVPVFTATTALTDGPDTMVATATVSVSSSLSQADGLDTLVAAGSTTAPTFTSTLALTDGVDTIVATIASGTLHTGTVAVTDGIDTLVASAQATAPAFTSTVAQTDGIDTLVAAVSTTAPTFTSTLVKTDGIDTLVASVSTTAPTFTGTLALTDGPDALVASGSTTAPTFTGTLALTDGPDTLVASASAGAVGAAILAITDGIDTMVATATTTVPTFTGTLSISDRVDTIVTSLSLTVPLFVSTFSQTDGVDSIVTAVNAIPPPNPSTLSLSDGLDTLTAFVSAGAVGAAVLALADGIDTITAAGTTTAPTFTASLALTDGVDTLLSVPTAVVPTQTSTLSVSDGPDALTALVATTAPTYSGSVAVTDGIDSMVAAASAVTPTTTSNLVVTDGPDTILVTGTTVAPTFTSTLALTDGADSIVATGTHAAPGNSAGALTITDGQDTIVAAATTTIPTLLGTFVVADGTDTLAAVIAFVAINDPTLAVTDGADTIVASASATVPLLLSTFAATDSPDTLAGIGSTVPPTLTGSMAATETPDLLFAVGTSAAPGNSAGALTISDGLDTLVASATRTIPTVTATVAVSDGVDTLEATIQSVPINSVALAQSDGLDTIVTSTSLTVPLLVGFIIITDGTDTMAGVLTSVVPTFTSTLGFIDGADTIDAFATAAVPLATSTLTFTDNRDTIVSSASATPPTHTGTIDFTDGRDTIVTSVVAGAVGAAVLAISDGLDTMVAVANTVVPTFTSTATGTDGRDSLEVSIATIPPTHSSTLALTDGVDALVALAVSTPPLFTATLALTDGQDTLVIAVAHVVPTFTGNTVTTDGRDTFVAVGLHAPPGNSAGGFGATDGRDTMVAAALCLFGHTILNGYKLEMRRLDLLRACTRVDEEREMERTDKPTVIRPAASEKGILIP